MSIEVKQINGVGWILMDREHRFNSVNRDLALSALEALDSFDKNDEIRCVVLTGKGKAFCAGQDLKEATSGELTLKQIISEHYNPLVRKVRSLRKPVIAAVNGVAAGAGASLALICDIIVAKESAYFSQAFCHIGLVPDTASTYFLPRAVGFQKAMALSMLGDKIYASEAEKMGMIYKSVPDSEFDEYVVEISTKLASMPTAGLALTKQAINMSMHNDLESQLQLELKLQEQAAQTHDFKEGVQAFLEKRKPNFIGK